MKKWKSAAATRIKNLSGADSIDDGITIIVKKLLQEVECPPTDLEKVMEKLEISACHTDDNMLVPGEIRRVNKKLEIFLIPGLSQGRKRFTIAHELGHALIESSGKGYPKHGDELEKICDKIAAEILMPKHVLCDLIGDDPNIYKVLELSKAFLVSFSAMLARTSDLYKTKAFLVNDGRVTWSTGITQEKAASSFYDFIERCKTEESGKETVHFQNGSKFQLWNMEWQNFAKGKNTVFYLTR